MRYEKLNALVATRVMGWRWVTGDAAFGIWANADGTAHDRSDCGWDPATDLNDAHRALEAVGKDEWWVLAKNDDGYTCDSGAIKAPFGYSVATPALALVYCALTIAGVSEAEIVAALE